MRKIALLLAMLLAFLPMNAAAEVAPYPAESITSRAALLMDADSGKILFAKNEDEALPVASITKIMTLLLAFEAVDAGRMSLSDTISVSQHAASMGGSQVLLEAGGQYAASDLIKSIIVASANDAAVAVAEYLAGSEDAFVTCMNKRAAELDMENTVFANCNGLPSEEGKMSAHNVAIMTRALMCHEEYFQYSRIWTDEITHAGGRVTMLTNTNKLIRNYDGCDGVKTGFTNAAGFCVSSSAKRGDTRMLAVILGGTSSKERFAQAEALLNYGFAHYETQCFLEAGQAAYENVTVPGWRDKVFQAVAKEKLFVLAEKGSDDARVQYELFSDLKAPMQAGDVVGRAYVQSGEAVLAETALVCDRDIPSPRLADYWHYLLNNWCTQK